MMLFETLTLSAKNNVYLRVSTASLFSLIVVFIFSIERLNAQIKIGENHTEINSGSILELESDVKGLKLTSISIQNLSVWGLEGDNPVDGMMIYNSNPTIGEGVYSWFNNVWNKMNLDSGGLSSELLLVLQTEDTDYSFDVTTGTFSHSSGEQQVITGNRGDHLIIQNSENRALATYIWGEDVDDDNDDSTPVVSQWFRIGTDPLSLTTDIIDNHYYTNNYIVNEITNDTINRYYSTGDFVTIVEQGDTVTYYKSGDRFESFYITKDNDAAKVISVDSRSAIFIAPTYTSADGFYEGDLVKYTYDNFYLVWIFADHDDNPATDLQWVALSQNSGVADDDIAEIQYKLLSDLNTKPALSGDYNVGDVIKYQSVSDLQDPTSVLDPYTVWIKTESDWVKTGEGGVLQPEQLYTIIASDADYTFDTSTGVFAQSTGEQETVTGSRGDHLVIKNSDDRVLGIYIYGEDVDDDKDDSTPLVSRWFSIGKDSQSLTTDILENHIYKEGDIVNNETQEIVNKYYSTGDFVTLVENGDTVTYYKSDDRFENFYITKDNDAAKVIAVDSKNAMSTAPAYTSADGFYEGDLVKYTYEDFYVVWLFADHDNNPATSLQWIASSQNSDVSDNDIAEVQIKLIADLNSPPTATGTYNEGDVIKYVIVSDLQNPASLTGSYSTWIKTATGWKLFSRELEEVDEAKYGVYYATFTGEAISPYSSFNVKASSKNNFCLSIQELDVPSLATSNTIDGILLEYPAEWRKIYFSIEINGKVFKMMESTLTTKVARTETDQFGNETAVAYRRVRIPSLGYKLIFD